jgi:hypothetical protein
MPGFWITGGLLLGALASMSASAGEHVVSRPQSAQISGREAGRTAALERPEAGRPGAFCLPGGCASRPASLWNGVAFGAALLAIGWRARRHPSASV